MNKSNSVRNERFFYLIVWTIFAILPIILELWKLINNSEFMWDHVVRWWEGMLPLILLFFIHNGLLIPKLMKTGRLKTYCLALAGIIIVYPRGGIGHLLVGYLHFLERDVVGR